MTGQLAFDALEAETVAVISAVDDDWRREQDRATIDDAVRRVAARDNGAVDTNAIRKELTGPSGLIVNPRCIGPRLASLTRSGVLEWRGEWNVNDDAVGRNSGRPQKLRRWAA